MPKKQKLVAKRAKKSSAKRKKLEARIEEERKKLEQMQREQEKILKKGKSGKKASKNNAGKKRQELSDKLKQKKEINAKSKAQDIQKKIDYHRFLEQQMVKLDYSAMFSYLGSLKPSSYEYSSKDMMKSIIYRKEETLSREEIREFTEDWKMQQIMNFSRAWESSDKRTMYHWWKYLNPGAATVMYELSLT